jgi:transposase-like protein
VAAFEALGDIFDYFVCPLPIIERWADALAQQDEELQQKIEAEMPRFVTLKNLGQDDFNMLSQCVEGGTVDTVRAVGDVDLVKAVSEEEGPWVMAFRRPAIEAIARMDVNESLLQRWVKAVAEFNGRKEEHCRETLTADAAKTLKEMCPLAVKDRLGVFTCFYG